jgi:hypothetical protein
MSDHWHYADEIHGAAEQHHRHYDTESEIRGLRQDLNRALARISDLEAGPEEEPEPGDYDPGPEVDDEGGMSEYRYAGIGEEP